MFQRKLPSVAVSAVMVFSIVVAPHATAQELSETTAETTAETSTPEEAEQPPEVTLYQTPEESEDSTEETPVDTTESERPMDEEYSPRYSNSTVIAGQSATSEVRSSFPAGARFELASQPPGGWTVSIDSFSGAVTASTDSRLAEGTSLKQRVNVTYPDGSSDTAIAAFVVAARQRTDSQRFQAAYSRVSVDPGQGTEIAPKWQGQSAPEGATFALLSDPPALWSITVDQSTGAARIGASDRLPAGDAASVPVRVTFADGSTSRLELHATVSTAPPAKPGSFASRLNPTVRDVVMSPDHLATAQVKGGPFPTGTFFRIISDRSGPVSSVIDANTGRLTLIPNSSAKPGLRKRVMVEVSYPDGSADVASAQVSIIDPSHSIAGRVDPSYPNGYVPFGQKITLRTDEDVPAGTEFSVEGDAPLGWTWTVDKNSGELDVRVHDNIVDVSSEIPVKATYSDDSTDTVYVHVEVTDLAGHMRLHYPSTGMEFGEQAQARIQGAPAETTFDIVEQPGDGWTAEIDEHGQLTVASPKNEDAEDNKDITVRVIFPDRSATTVEAEFATGTHATQSAMELEPAQQPVAQSMAEVIDRLGLTDYVDPTTGKLIQELPDDVEDRIHAGFGASGNGQAVKPEGDRVILVTLDGMLDLVATGLPFILERIRSGQIRVAES